jgi:hypothetical protein
MRARPVAGAARPGSRAPDAAWRALRWRSRDGMPGSGFGRHGAIIGFANAWVKNFQVFQMDAPG